MFNVISNNREAIKSLSLQIIANKLAYDIIIFIFTVVSLAYASAKPVIAEPRVCITLVNTLWSPNIIWAGSFMQINDPAQWSVGLTTFKEYNTTQLLNA